MEYLVMSLLECPDCKSAIKLQSNKTNAVVCSVCKAAWFRDSNNILQQFPADTTIERTDFIQIGSGGKYDNNPFIVTGRFAVHTDEAVFNYWNVLFEDGSIACLAEAYGLFQILRPSADAAQPFMGRNMKPRGMVDLGNGLTYIVEKLQQVQHFEAEGEWYQCHYSTSLHIVELAAWNGNRLILFDFGKDMLFGFDCYNTSFKELQLTDLQLKEPDPFLFRCETCGTECTVKNAPYSASYACHECSSWYRLDRTGAHKIAKGKKPVVPSVFNAGDRGTIKGAEWEVIGYTQKQEMNADAAKWREYTLFNRTEGYAFLSEYDNNWIFLRESTDAPMVENENIRSFLFGGREYLLYSSYGSKVIHAWGAFPANIFDDTNAQNLEYISPPYMWAREADGTEGVCWFKGEYVSRRELANGFQNKELPISLSMGVLQPGHPGATKLTAAILIGFILILLVHFLAGMGRQNRIVSDGQYTFADSANKITVTTPHFELDRWRSNLRFDIKADVSNSWMEMDATLINMVTGKQYSLEKGVEYYFGYEGGESWSEGGTSEVAYLNRIPSGNYYLELTALRAPGDIGRPSYAGITVTYDVASNRNLWIALIFFSLWPIWAVARGATSEHRRWSGSDYAVFHGKIAANNEDE